ncbi:MAG TPA: ribulose-phosphate 3-epimerase [Euzebyales bacterium]|nr:ribulose-phosphate 3-epimerase [Euzebyales bacterium]
MRQLIVPSVLSSDFSRLGEACAEFERAGADRLQWDVMDGHYVPNLSFGPDVIASCRDLVSCEFEAHIMCDRPEELLPRYVEAGCQWVLVHPETLRQPHRTYQRIRELGARVGVALSPASPLTHLDHVLDLVDMVLIMTVNPGFGGQEYLVSMEPKIRRTREMITRSGRDIDIEVDGGVSAETIGGAARAGANVFISGSSLARADDLAKAIDELRGRAREAVGQLD